MGSRDMANGRVVLWFWGYPPRGTGLGILLLLCQFA